MPLRGGGVRRLMANTILNFHFDYWNTSLMCLQTTYLQGILQFPDVQSLGQNQVLRQLARIDHYKIVTDDIRSCLLKQRNCKALLMELLLGGHQEIGLYGLGVCKYKQKPKDKDSIKYVIKIFFFSKMAILG